MVKYKFKLIKSYKPDLTQKKDKDQQYGGIRLIYDIYKIYYFNVKISLRGHTFNKSISWFKWKLGRKTFLRPYKKYWDKHTYRLPYPYWGKKSNPLTRLWVVIPNNYPLGITKITPKVSLVHHYVKLFEYNFTSKSITSQLFGEEPKTSFIINQTNLLR